MFEPGNAESKMDRRLLCMGLWDSHTILHYVYYTASYAVQVLSWCQQQAACFCPSYSWQIHNLPKSDWNESFTFCGRHVGKVCRVTHTIPGSFFLFPDSFWRTVLLFVYFFRLLILLDAFYVIAYRQTCSCLQQDLITSECLMAVETNCLHFYNPKLPCYLKVNKYITLSVCDNLVC